LDAVEIVPSRRGELVYRRSGSIELYDQAIYRWYTDRIRCPYGTAGRAGEYWV